MKKTGFPILILITMLTTLTGCAGIGDKSANMSIVYLATAIFSFVLLSGYFIYPKRNAWFVVLFTCVFIVNAGYYALSVSQTLNGALWTNRISYLGSVFLPLAMLMIMVNVCRLQYPRILPCCLSIISMVVFFIAASPGYLDIYYKSVQTTDIAKYQALLRTLTPTERMIFDHYHEGHTSKEIMQFMNIKENTLKYHNKNIYNKLGISSRKQLLAMAEMLTQEK